jgi:hypothetical protein
MKNKLVVILVGLGAIALAMALTNPQKEKYLEYASVKLSEDIQNVVCKSPENKSPKDILGNLTNLVADVCKIGIDSQDILVKKLIEPRTQHQNMVFFSVYTTEIPGRTYKTIAVFNNFFTSN